MDQVKQLKAFMKEREMHIRRKSLAEVEKTKQEKEKEVKSGFLFSREDAVLNNKVTNLPCQPMLQSGDGSRPPYLSSWAFWTRQTEILASRRSDYQ